MQIYRFWLKIEIYFQPKVFYSFGAENNFDLKGRLQWGN